MRAELEDTMDDSLGLYTISRVCDEAHSSRLVNVTPVINGVAVLITVDICVDVIDALSDVWQKLEKLPLQTSQ